jgi:hypothetical protein
VTGHPAGGCADAFGLSTAPFADPRPDGLESMSDSYVEGMRRRLRICIPLSRMGCFLLTRTRTISSAQIPASPCWLSTPDWAVEANGGPRF